jgi:hypothetical protein
MSEQYRDKTIKSLKERFAVTTINGRQVILDVMNKDAEVHYTVLLSSAGQLEAKYHHATWGDDYMSLLAELRGRLPQIIMDEYLPGKDALVLIAGGFANQFIKNRYKEPEIKPTDEFLKPGMFLDFMKRQFPVLDEMEMVIALMAMNIRRPERKIRQALLIRGEQGTGKGVLMDTIWGRLVGSNYFKCRCKNVTARFNEFLANNTTICIDELYSNQKKNADNLKTIITDQRFPIEGKGKDITSPENYCFIIATSNDWSPIYIEENDRRWFVPMFSRHEDSKEETQDFISKRFIPWLENDGLQAIRNYLETIDLHRFNFDMAMNTQSKRELIRVDPREELMEELECFLKDGCYHGVRLKALQDRFKGLGDNEIRQVLKKSNYQRDKNAKKYVEAKRYRWWTNNLQINSGRYLCEADNGFKEPLTYINNNTLKDGVSDVPLDSSLYLSGFEQYTDTFNKDITTVLEVCHE